MNKTALIVSIIVIIILLILGAWWFTNRPTSTPSTNSQPAAQNQTKGTMYVSVTDAAVNMGSVTAVDMTVDSVSLHSQSQGWVTVSSAPGTFALLSLKASGNAALVAKMDVPVDTYDQIWFHVKSVNVTASGKTKVATLPSPDVKLNSTIKVAANTASTAKLDVLADQSLHVTADGTYVFAPTVTLETRDNATVAVDANNIVTVSGGTVDTNLSAGMDVDGQMKNNFKLDTAAKLNISNGIINIQGSTGTNINVGQ